MTEFRLILGDQLNPRHSWFSEVRPDVVYLLLELHQETSYVLHHAQKILGIFAAMRDFATQLRQAGHRVRYVRIDETSNRPSLCANLDALIAHYQADRLLWQEPDEFRLDQALHQWASQLSIPAAAVDSEHFFTQRQDAAEFFKGKRQWRMEYFYRAMRQKHAVLMTADNKPAGGQWNFDADNRRTWKGQPLPAPDLRPLHDHSALWQTICNAGVTSFGEACAKNFRWPLNRVEALQQLDYFIEHQLPFFGDYQDAMHSQQPFLFHSLLSFGLNLKMLDPAEVVQAAAAAWHAGRVPLAAAEGFIRQILGWREYIRGIYWASMPEYVSQNSLQHQLPLPPWFWNGQTRMRCLSAVIGQSLQTAYAHHIQRLMVTGNFALLAGLDPQQLHEWYLGIYIDAFEWVELPNTLGMSQFADGGKLASKPYVSSAAYLQRMSNYCSDCAYQPKQRTGEHACPFNALYWDFFARHFERFERNPRLAFVYKQLKQFSQTELDAIKERADYLKQNLNTL